MKLINQSSLLVVISLLLLASLVGNLFLYKELKFVYLSWYATSLNPLAINKYSQDKPEKTIKDNQKKVVFFGDSRAVDWSKPELEKFQFINRGIDGQTSGQVLLRFEQHIAVLQPDIIVVQVGVNDLRMLSRSENTRQGLVQNCQDNITQIVQKAREIGAKVIVTTIFPLGEGNVPLKTRLFWPSINQLKQDINEVNDHIKTLDQNAVIFDTYKLLKAQGDDSGKYYQDLLHLNGQGYGLLNQKLSELLITL